MPRGRFFRAWFLHQHMFMKQIDLAALHQGAGDGGGGGMAQKRLIFRNALPGTVIAKEHAGLAFRRIAFAEGSGFAEVAFHPAGEQFHPMRCKGLADHHRAIAVIIGDSLGIEDLGHWGASCFAGKFKPPLDALQNGERSLPALGFQWRLGYSQHAATPPGRLPPRQP